VDSGESAVALILILVYAPRVQRPKGVKNKSKGKTQKSKVKAAFSQSIAPRLKRKKPELKAES
jgi:hypothetical protein